MRTHKHTDLADSSTALIADLNRPGDLSLSLTHTRHTSFFFFFPPPSPLPPLLFLSPKLSFAFYPVSLCINLLLPAPLSPPEMSGPGLPL